MPTSRRSTDKPPRRRRDVAVVRAEILDAAERRMVEVGPDGLRLQDIAADVGISHPNVLHHFGSKDALLGALTERSIDGMRAQIVEAIAEADTGGDRLTSLFEALTGVLERGQARLLFWFTLGGRNPVAGTRWLSDVVDAALELRKSRGQKLTPTIKTDTQHVVMLAALALAGSAVLWPALSGNVGVPDDREAQQSFRRWFAEMLLDHMKLR